MRLGLAPCVLGALVASAAPSATQSVVTVGGCATGIVGDTAPVSRSIRNLCERRSRTIGSQGQSVEAVYGETVRGFLRQVLSVDSTVCVAVRCSQPRLTSFRFVVLPDSGLNAQELPTAAGGIDVLMTTGLLDLITATAATLGTDMTRELCGIIPNVFGPPTDCDRERLTLADSGALSWLRTLNASSGLPCDRLPKYAYPFQAADSGFITVELVGATAEAIVAHELAHIETDLARCGYRGDDAAGRELACDSIATNVVARRGYSPLEAIALFTVMGHVESLFGPSYSALATPASDPANYRDIRDWNGRARAMSRVWRAISRRDSARFAFADSLLGVPLPSPCVRTAGRSGVASPWGAAPAAMADRPLTKAQAGASLARMKLSLDLDGFAKAVSNAWASVAKLYLTMGMAPGASLADGSPVAFLALNKPSWLCFACGGESERRHTLETLIEGGFPVNASDAAGRTALMLAQDTSSMRVLLEHGADARAIDRDGTSALLYAVDRRDVRAVELLLRRGADPNAYDGGAFGARQTPLLRARGDSAVVAMLLDHGAKPDLPDSRGWTPLLKAIQAKNVSAVRLLLSRGADPNGRTPYGRSALAVALGSNTAEIVQLLEHAGGKQ